MDTAFITDVYEFEFRGVKLLQTLKTVSDKIAFRNAVHEFIKRDGASIERMGRKAAEFRMGCFFQGPNWRRDYANLIAKLSENNKGPLVHPLLGPMDAACDLLEGSSTFGTGRDLIEFTLTFTEDRVDVLLGAQSTPRPLEQSSIAQASASRARGIANQNFPQSGPTVQSFVGAVSAYTAAAELAISDIVAAAQLPTLLDAVGRNAALSTQALLIDPAIIYDSDAYDVIQALEESYAAAIAMQEAILSQVAIPVTRQVIVSGPLIALCQNWYPGPDAYRYSQIIEQLNPTLPDTSWVPQGTRLTIPPPTLEVSA